MRLNADEKRLLTHPPTETTWECRRARLDDEGQKIACRAANNGRNARCWLCAGKKPDKPTRIWPRYLDACAKAGIEPGERWTNPADALEYAVARRQARKAAK